MGTDFRIILYAPDSLTARSASNAAYERIKELEKDLSDYKEDSELNRLSRSSGSGKSVLVSNHLFKVLEKAVEMSNTTDGAFDITIGPYVELWRITRRTQRIPSDEQVKEAGKSVGYRSIIIDKNTQTVKLQKEGMQLDAGGIAKGYAADEALAVLRSFNIHAALIQGGGDIVVGQAPPDRDGWDVVIGIIENNKQVNRRLTVQDKAISTSGDLFQYIEVDGIRYSHIINPHSGLGLTNQSKVTVIAPNGITSDSFASAFSILGPEKSLGLVTSPLEFYFICENEGEYESWQSSGFEAFLTK